MTLKHTPGEIRVDCARPEDWPRVRQLRLLALAIDPDAFGSTLADESELCDDNWRERVGRPGTTFFLATDGKTEVGLARLTIQDGVAGLFSMWVSPTHRGRGIGRMFVARAAAEARSRGHSQLFLEVVDSNHEAVRLYSRCGFVPTGRISAMPAPRSHVTEHERVLML